MVNEFHSIKPNGSSNNFLGMHNEYEYWKTFHQIVSFPYYQIFIRGIGMVNQLLRQLTVKKIIWIILILAAVIYVTYYVVDALDGFDPNYRPHFLLLTRRDCVGCHNIATFFFH